MTCAQSAGTGTKLAKEQDRKDQTDQGRGTVEKELMNGRVAEEMMEARKEARKAAWAASPTGTGTKTREALGTQGQRPRARARARFDIAMTAESKDFSA